MMTVSERQDLDFAARAGFGSSKMIEGASAMSDNGDEGRVDVSPAAVNARLAAFVAEHREAQARGDPRALRESDALLAAMCEQALEAQARADLAQAEGQRRLAEIQRRLAEVEADGWRMRGGRMQ